MICIRVEFMTSPIVTTLGKVPSCILIKCLVSVFLHDNLVPSYILFTAVLPKRLYKTHTRCIHYHLRDKTRRSHHGLIKRVRQIPSLLTLSPFPLAFVASFLPPVFISIFLNFLGYARGNYLVLQPRFYRLLRVR